MHESLKSLDLRIQNSQKRKQTHLRFVRGHIVSCRRARNETNDSWLSVLGVIALLCMWEGKWMAKLCHGLSWNLILTYILKCGNDIQTIHP